MKEYTSSVLKGISYFFLLFPITYLVLAALVFNIEADRIFKIFWSYSFWMLSLLAIFAGYSLKEAKRWCWNLLVFTACAIGYTNAILIFRYSKSLNKGLAFSVSLLGLIFILFRAAREIRVPYFLPKIRWWEANPRFKWVLPVKVERATAGFEGQILDISMGGCFIKCRMDFEQNEKIKIDMVLFGESAQLTGTVVWRSQASVTHPKGIGVKFDLFEGNPKKVMGAAMKHLKKIQVLQDRKNRYSPEDFKVTYETLKNYRLNLALDDRPHESKMDGTGAA